MTAAWRLHEKLISWQNNPELTLLKCFDAVDCGIMQPSLLTIYHNVIIPIASYFASLSVCQFYTSSGVQPLDSIISLLNCSKWNLGRRVILIAQLNWLELKVLPSKTNRLLWGHLQSNFCFFARASCQQIRYSSYVEDEDRSHCIAVCEKKNHVSWSLPFQVIVEEAILVQHPFRQNIHLFKAQRVISRFLLSVAA